MESMYQVVACVIRNEGGWALNQGNTAAAPVAFTQPIEGLKLSGLGQGRSPVTTCFIRKHHVSLSMITLSVEASLHNAIFRHKYSKVQASQ